LLHIQRLAEGVKRAFLEGVKYLLPPGLPTVGNYRQRQLSVGGGSQQAATFLVVWRIEIEEDRIDGAGFESANRRGHRRLLQKQIPMADKRLQYLTKSLIGVNEKYALLLRTAI
jgi:hypothetical protein